MAVTIEYIAGFFDGEGSISYIRSTRTETDRFCYTPMINIAQQKDGVLYMIRDFFGFGYVNGEYENNRCSDLQIRSITDVVTFLNAVIPHLVVKKQRAIDMLALCEMRISELDKAYNIPYSEEFVSAVNEFRGDALS